VYLTAGVRPHGDVAVCSACEPRVDACAIGGLALFAVEAAPVGDVERHDHAIALFEKRHAWAHGVDDAHVLVAYEFPRSATELIGCSAEFLGRVLGDGTEYETAFCCCPPLIHVQI